MNIKWLKKFKKIWLEKNIDEVLNLFSDDLVYFETPYQKITDKNILKKEWEYIKNHKIKTLDFEIFSEMDNKLVVNFKYIYNLNGEDRKFFGIYLIKIKNGRCNYFYQVGE